MSNHPFRVGFLINPIAGMGGRVGLHGTDGSLYLEAEKLGAKPASASRAAITLARISTDTPWELITAPGPMGEELLVSPHVNKSLKARSRTLEIELSYPTSAIQTQEVVKALVKENVDLILFAGGDGTARDIFAIIHDSLPMVGIPAGVKMRSGVFGLHPGDVATLLSRAIEEHQRFKSVRTTTAEILDLPPSASVEHYSTSEFFGVAKTIYAPELMQRSKSASGRDGEVALAELASDYAKRMERGKLYLFGPGGSTNLILTACGFEATPQGVHAVLDGKLIGSNLSESAIAQLLARNSQCELVVGVIGGQGFLFGRGNQELSAAIIEKVGWSRIFILASASKLLELVPTQLHMEFSEPLATTPPAFVQVHTATTRTVVCRLLHHVASGDITSVL